MIKERMGVVLKQADGSEIVNYNNPPFPAYIYDGYVFKGCTWEKVPHYHEDLEIVSVYEGHMAYSVNGREIKMSKGDTIVINSGMVHYSIAPEGRVCRYVICVMHPRIMYTNYYVEDDAIKPIITDKSLPYIHFKNTEYDAEDMKNLVMSFRDVSDNTFLITKKFYEIWELIMNRYNDAYRTYVKKMTEEDEHSMILKKMMLYIDKQYTESIVLKDIADAGGISISLCSQIFKRMTQKSPIEYVMHYRCKKVADYLLTSDLNMSEIAEVTGFSGSSYMSETFKKFYSLSPREYKKKIRA